jgi:putative endopeptidase
LWQEYFETLGEGYLEYSRISALCVINPTFLEFVSGLLGEKLNRLELMQKYAKWKILLTFSPFLTKAFSAAHFRFFGEKLRGQPEPEERWVWLLGYLNQHAGHLLGKLYCDACFPSSSKEHVMEIARTVIEEQKKLISEVEWMEDNTKAHAHEKLNNLLLKVGCPDNYEDYSTFTPSKKDSFVAIIRQLSVFNMKTNLLLANKPTDREKWLVAPQEADGFYHIFRNELSTAV